MTSRVEPALVPASTGTRPAAASRVACEDVAPFLGAEGVVLAGAAQRDQAVDALADQWLDVFGEVLKSISSFAFIGVTRATRTPWSLVFMSRFTSGAMDRSGQVSCIQMVFSSVYW